MPNDLTNSYCVCATVKRRAVRSEQRSFRRAGYSFLFVCIAILIDIRSLHANSGESAPGNSVRVHITLNQSIDPTLSQIWSIDSGSGLMGTVATHLSNKLKACGVTEVIDRQASNLTDEVDEQVPRPSGSDGSGHVHSYVATLAVSDKSVALAHSVSFQLRASLRLEKTKKTKKIISKTYTHYDHTFLSNKVSPILCIGPGPPCDGSGVPHSVDPKRLGPALQEVVLLAVGDIAKRMCSEISRDLRKTGNRTLTNQ